MRKTLQGKKQDSSLERCVESIENLWLMRVDDLIKYSKIYSSLSPAGLCLCVTLENKH